MVVTPAVPFRNFLHLQHFLALVMAEWSYDKGSSLKENSG